MRLFLIFTLSVLFCACGRDASQNRAGYGSAQSGESAPHVTRQPATGDTVIYMFDEYHFYEAKLLSVDGGRAKLLYDERTVERDASDVYPIPKAGDKVTVKAGDFVAARYGKLPTWPTAKVVQVGDDKITVKWLTGAKDVVEVSPENVLAVSPSAAAKIQEAAAKEGL
jgi:hypothetical protein